MMSCEVRTLVSCQVRTLGCGQVRNLADVYEEPGRSLLYDEVLRQVDRFLPLEMGSFLSDVNEILRHFDRFLRPFDDMGQIDALAMEF